MKPWVWGVLAGLVVLGISRRASGAPGAGPVVGDLERNWGTTPAWLRPILLRVEQVSRIPGAARFLAVASKRESGWNPKAHNETTTGGANGRGEVGASQDAYAARQAKLPKLAHGQAAANFGSGGLFGLLAPYFLWTGTPEVGGEAPLLDLEPTSVFNPEIAAFAAAVYMQRIIDNYDVEDWGDVRAGWASPSLLTSGRGGEKYNEVRERFAADAAKVGIDLDDAATIPKKPDASAWPGVLKVYAGMTEAPVNS